MIRGACKAALGVVLAGLAFGAVSEIAFAQNVTTVVEPNGGECLAVGQSFTIEFSWSGPDVEHIAIYYRTDGAQPAHLDSSVIKHPINVPQQGTTWDWTPNSGHISETGRIWVDGHGNGHNSLGTWDQSDGNIFVRSSCTAGAITRSAATESVRISEVTPTEATIAWVTSYASYTKLEYGTSTQSYTKEYAVDPSITRFNHSAVLTGLEPNTMYYFRTISGATASEKLTSYEYIFTTLPPPDTVPPAKVGALFAVPGSASVLLSWTNPPDPDWKETFIVRRTDRFAAHRGDGELVFVGSETNHRDDELTNGTAYYYAIFTVDAWKNVSAPATLTLTPQAGLEEAPSSPPTGELSRATTTALRIRSLASKPATSTIALNWKNPEEESFLGVQIVRNDTSLPAHLSDGTVIFRGRAERYEDRGLEPERRYFYGIFPFDWANEPSSGSFVSDRTDPTQESIETLVAGIEEARQLVREIQTSLGIPAEPEGEPEAAEMRELTRTLRFGMSGEEVHILQGLLARDADVYPEGTVSGYFGPLTRRAVQRFQERHQIASSGDETTTGYGLVGPKTRAKLKEVYR